MSGRADTKRWRGKAYPCQTILRGEEVQKKGSPEGIVPASLAIRRGDWIRTSDLLNPIQQAAFKKGRFSVLFCNQRLPAITIFTAFAAFGMVFIALTALFLSPTEAGQVRRATGSSAEEGVEG
jgi:hypothetical protein